MTYDDETYRRILRRNRRRDLHGWLERRPMVLAAIGYTDFDLMRFTNAALGGPGLDRDDLHTALGQAARMFRYANKPALELRMYTWRRALTGERQRRAA